MKHAMDAALLALLIAGTIAIFSGGTEQEAKQERSQETRQETHQVDTPEYWEVRRYPGMEIL